MSFCFPRDRFERVAASVDSTAGSSSESGAATRSTETLYDASKSRVRTRCAFWMGREDVNERCKHKGRGNRDVWRELRSRGRAG